MFVTSSGDMLALIAELNGRRIARVTGQMAKRSGGRLDLPQRVIEMLQTARRIHHRFAAGDYRHELSEQDRIRDLCQWLVEQHNLLQGRTSTDKGATRMSWDGAALQAKTPVAPGAYLELIDSIHDGRIDGSAEEDGVSQ